VRHSSVKIARLLVSLAETPGQQAIVATVPFILAFQVAAISAAALADKWQYSSMFHMATTRNVYHIPHLFPFPTILSILNSSSFVSE